MKKKLLVVSLLLITGCIEFNEEKKEPKKKENRVNIKENKVKNTEKHIEKYIKTQTENYTKKNTENYTEENYTEENYTKKNTENYTEENYTENNTENYTEENYTENNTENYIEEKYTENNTENYTEEKNTENNTEKYIKNYTKNNIEKYIENYTENNKKTESELKKYLNDYLARLSSLDTESVIDMTYPKLFIPINKNMFKQYINNILTSNQISVESYNTHIINIGEVQPYNNGEFAKLKYSTTIKLAFTNPNLYNDELSIRVLNDILSKKYGQENIQIDPINRVITIKEEQKLLAIKDNNINDGWKFVGDNPEYRKLYPKILPKEILSQI